jgi:hypothetical protein
MILPAGFCYTDNHRKGGWTAMTTLTVAAVFFFLGVWLTATIFAAFSRSSGKKRTARPAPLGPEREKHSDDGWLLEQARSDISRLKNIASAEPMRSQAQKLAHVAELIVLQLEKDPEKLRRARQFLRYYLPSSVNLLGTYQDLSLQGYRGGNVRASMEKIERSMPGVEKAFLRELDGLYQDKAYDISAEITVLENLIESGGK